LKIKVLPDGDWDLPNGSVLMKQFSVAGKRVETRLFVRHDDGGWAGYSYRWDDAETDATLLPANLATPVWYYPSRSECVTCHSAAANGTLGLETGQLNGPFVYATATERRRANQIETLDHIGMFETAPGAQKYPTPTDPATGDLQARAKAYLHAN